MPGGTVGKHLRSYLMHLMLLCHGGHPQPSFIDAAFFYSLREVKSLAEGHMVAGWQN